jgi:aminopeptidase N
MRTDSPPVIHLKNYKPTPYSIRHVELDVQLHETNTVVLSRLHLKPRKSGKGALVLNGEGLGLHSITINGVAISDYLYENGLLSIKNLPRKPFILEIEQSCNPKANTALSGLYLSNGMFCTQMEAQGFRRFAFHYDRPDVMATYRVRIEAPRSLPILLGNGNPVTRGKIGTTRHYAVWDDPHPKPAYLFALVAGDLASVQSSFKTSNGRKVKLGIYVEKGKEDRCDWAMTSLKASMRWDEKAFGRVYDLDVFNIVAVSDFNMGAMENKGLNIFNDKYVLARPDTATDMDYMLIEAIIAHEYFHNWTGNRITCRDWFQLCLKEGLTVFRDQEFTSDMRSRAVKRINDVKTLRARQFPEDQGPLSHPVRPSSYIEINNFYTPTVYEKGAELVRMIKTLIGEVAFRKAMDLYFKRHDGEAATIEQFVACMEKAARKDLSHFFRWYQQSGTPRVKVRTKFNAKAQTFTVDIAQSTTATAAQKIKRALHIPLRVGLVGDTGTDLPLRIKGKQTDPILELTKPQQTFVFTGIAERPRLSFNRGFSAPVVVESDLTPEDLLHLMAHDSDSFNRWEAAQTLGRALILSTMTAMRENRLPPLCDHFADALKQTLNNNALDDAFKALMLALPPEAEIAGSAGGNADADLVVAARDHVRKEIAQRLSHTLHGIVATRRDNGAYKPDTNGTARRSLCFAALQLLGASDATAALSLAESSFARASNMSMELGSIGAVLAIDHPRRDAMLDAFYRRHSADHLLVDKWFLLNAGVPGLHAHKRISTLMAHKDFKLTTPNRVYALVAGFAGGNLSGFHAASGEGYRVVADAIIALNGINPQVAARVATGFRSWRLFDQVRRGHAQIEMKRILRTPSLSSDVFEIISKTLNG